MGVRSRGGGPGLTQAAGDARYVARTTGDSTDQQLTTPFLVNNSPLQAKKVAGTKHDFVRLGADDRWKVDAGGLGIDWGADAAKTGLVLLSETVLGADTAGPMTFNNIPQTFRALRLIIRASSTVVGQSRRNLYLRCNNDSTAGRYQWRVIEMEAAYATAASGAAETSIRTGLKVAAAAAAPDEYMRGHAVIDILRYSLAERHLIRSDGGLLWNGADGGVHVGIGYYQQNAAITRLDVNIEAFGAGDTWRTGSWLGLFGCGLI